MTDTDEIERARDHLYRLEVAAVCRDLKTREDLDAGLRWYREVAAARYPKAWTTLADRALSAVSLMLGIELPALKWFTTASGPGDASIASDGPILGQVRPGDHAVWIAAEQPSVKCLVNVVAHEARHLTQEWPGAGDADEADAQTYARAVTPVLLQIVRAG